MTRASISEAPALTIFGTPFREKIGLNVNIPLTLAVTISIMTKLVWIASQISDIAPPYVIGTADTFSKMKLTKSMHSEVIHRDSLRSEGERLLVNLRRRL